MFVYNYYVMNKDFHEVGRRRQAPVGEWRDDESLGAAEKLVHVREVDVGD